MKVHELISELEMFDEDADIRLAFQPSWPLQYEISGVVEDRGHRHEPVFIHDDDSDVWYCDDSDCDAEWDREPRDYELGGDGPAVVYIAEGGQFYDAPYLPGSAQDALGWARR